MQATYETVKVKHAEAVVDVPSFASVDMLPGESADDGCKGGDVAGDEEEELDDVEPKHDPAQVGRVRRVRLGRLHKKHSTCDVSSLAKADGALCIGRGASSPGTTCLPSPR